MMMSSNFVARLQSMDVLETAIADGELKLTMLAGGEAGGEPALGPLKRRCPRISLHPAQNAHATLPQCAGKVNL